MYCDLYVQFPTLAQHNALVEGTNSFRESNIQAHAKSKPIWNVNANTSNQYRGMSYSRQCYHFLFDLLKQLLDKGLRGWQRKSM